MNKIFALLLAAAMIVPVTGNAQSLDKNGESAVISTAAVGGSVSCENATLTSLAIPFDVSAGETFRVIAHIKNVPNAAGFFGTIKYNPTLLKLGGTSSDAGQLCYNEPSRGTVMYNILFDAKGTNMTAGKDIVVFEFSARKNCTASTEIFSYSVNEYYDVNDKELDYSTFSIRFEKDNMNDSDTDTDVHIHTVVTDPAVSPTCTQTGLTEGSHCSVCGEVITAQSVIPATGHSYSDGVCTVCGEEDPNYKHDTDSDVQFIGKYGDLNKDGRISALDAYMLLRQIAGKLSFDSNQMTLADVNNDGRITSKDALEIQRSAAGMSVSSLVGKDAYK